MVTGIVRGMASDPGALVFSAPVFLAGAETAWHFVALPEEDADQVRGSVPMGRPGFGSERVEVTIGGSTWRTSVFPDSGRGTYLLPVKAAVRRAEGIAAGDEVEVRLTLLG